MFFQDLFLLLKVLNFGSRDGSVWTCAVHLLKCCYGRGKDVYKINCQAFPMLLSFTSSSPPVFLSNCQRDNEVPLSLPAKESQILELHSGLSTGDLMMGWSMWAHRSTFTCPLVNVARHAPRQHAHDGGCTNSSRSWISEMNWACWCGWVYALLSYTSVLQQNIKVSILITKYVSLRLPLSFSKREVFYIVWKCPANCAVWLGFSWVKTLRKNIWKSSLGEKVLSLKSAVEAVENNWGVEDTLQAAWSSLWVAGEVTFLCSVFRQLLCPHWTLIQSCSMTIFLVESFTWLAQWGLGNSLQVAYTCSFRVIFS